MSYEISGGDAACDTRSAESDNVSYVKLAAAADLSLPCSGSVNQWTKRNRELLRSRFDVISTLRPPSPRLLEHAHAAELLVAVVEQAVGFSPQFAEVPEQVRLQRGPHLARVAVCAAERLGDDVVDDAQALAGAWRSASAPRRPAAWSRRSPSSTGCRHSPPG